VIQIEAIKIVEFRGIRELNLTLGRKNFVISGPNGSGKSGVVDAIQFGLTGEISRLSGKGTSGLTVQKHGPHVDRRNNPSASEVSLTLYFPDLDKTAVLTRSVRRAKVFSLSPDDATARAIVEEAAQHPEFTLSRREIIKYILVEARERSNEIQALLKLEEIGQNRGVLKTASNRVTNTYKTRRQETENAANALLRHLDVAALTSEEILPVVNSHRLAIGLSPIQNMETDAVLDADEARGGPEPTFSKTTAIRDLEALQAAQENLAELGATEAREILEDIATLERDPALLEALRHRSFVEHGLEFVDGPHCPLCDVDWNDEEALKAHLRAKLERSQQAEAVRDRLLDRAATVIGHARQLAGLLSRVSAVASAEHAGKLADDLTAWAGDLVMFADSMTNAEEAIAQKARLQNGWSATPSSLGEDLAVLATTVHEKPDQSALVEAHSFLALARDRIEAYRQAQQAETRAKDAAETGRVAYTTYCDVSEQHLSDLYAAVEHEFSAFYRDINHDDEADFRARFEPDEGKLDLAVAFYGRGMFPPGAYHSEGHQDGMGVCLYLALMKHLLGSRFRFAVLDDVVMSVDSGHRRQFCRLLRTGFPETQLVITTHDKVWAKQMQTEGLVDSRSGVQFQRWSVETGPIFEEITGVWDQIESDLVSDDSDVAASRLRRHLEYVAGEVAHDIGAKVRYRGDHLYDFGDLLSAITGRQGELLKLAAKSARHWQNQDALAGVEAMQTTRSEILQECGGEQWVVNKAIHYNEWASFSSTELRAVVKTFKALLHQFRCPRAGCESWLYVIPRKGHPETLRCKCNSVSLNLALR